MRYLKLLNSVLTGGCLTWTSWSSLEGKSKFCDNKAAEQFPEILHKVTEDGQYTDEQL
jgi:hypothetical protein